MQTYAWMLPDAYSRVRHRLPADAPTLCFNPQTTQKRQHQSCCRPTCSTPGAVKNNTAACKAADGMLMTTTMQAAVESTHTHTSHRPCAEASKGSKKSGAYCSAVIHAQHSRCVQRLKPPEREDSKTQVVAGEETYAQSVAHTTCCSVPIAYAQFCRHITRCLHHEDGHHSTTKDLPQCPKTPFVLVHPCLTVAPMF